jgi:hypothetical protein
VVFFAEFTFSELQISSTEYDKTEY